MTGSEYKTRQKKRGILLASCGLLLALGIALGLKVVGVADFTYGEWAVAATITLVVQAVLWLIPHLGLDRYLTLDQRYLYLPMGAAAALLSLYAHIIFEGRVLILIAWPVALLFLAGLAGFREVLVLSSMMTVGYSTVVIWNDRAGAELSAGLEITIVAAFLVISVFAGIVFERLRRERIEMRALQRRFAELALTDPLTELPNRRRFEEILRVELERVVRYGGKCSLAMIDVDYFKRYNDSLGHLAGDIALKELAAIMRRQLRSSDVLARYGGEEFGLIMVNTSKDVAYQTIERLRQAVEMYPFRGAHVLPGRRLTISAGVASAPADGSSYEELVQMADGALYAAKQYGRNLVRTV